MFKKLTLLVVVLSALLLTATPAFADTNLCDPPPVAGRTRTLRITCYVDTSYTGTPETGTKDQPFKDANRAIAEARAHPSGGYVYNVQTGISTYYAFVNPPPTGAPISRTALFVLLGLASLILVTGGWLLRRRSGTLPGRV